MPSVFRPVLVLAATLASSALYAQNAELSAPPAAPAIPIGTLDKDQDKEKDKLLALLDDARSLARFMTNEPAFDAAVAQVREQIASASAAELAPLREFDPHFSHLEATLGRMSDRMGPVQADTELCDPARRADLFALFLDTLDADGQRAVNSRICDKLAGAEGAADKPLPVCLATNLAFAAARAMHDVVMLCDPTLERAKPDGSAERFEQLRVDLAGVKAGVQESVHTAKRDLTQAMTMVAGHVAEVSAANTEALQGSFAADRDQSLRYELETALRKGELYGMFYLPEAFGGRLEAARAIVVDTIQNVAASGGYQKGASAKLSAGDDQYTNRQFRKAFQSYSEAYLAAVGTAASDPQ